MILVEIVLQTPCRRCSHFFASHFLACVVNKRQWGKLRGRIWAIDATKKNGALPISLHVGRIERVEMNRRGSPLMYNVVCTPPRRTHSGTDGRNRQNMIFQGLFSPVLGKDDTLLSCAAKQREMPLDKTARRARGDSNRHLCSGRNQRFDDILWTTSCLKHHYRSESSSICSWDQQQKQKKRWLLRSFAVSVLSASHRDWRTGPQTPPHAPT